jgi:hypothetical protein
MTATARHGSYEGSQYKSTGHLIRAGMKDKSIVQLARTLYPLISWGTYDAYSAHRWAQRLIEADPQDARQTKAALCNYTWMVEGALADYDSNPTLKAKYQKIFDAFTAWKAVRA